MGKCSARRKARFMCTFRTPRQTASKTAKCILSSSFLTQAKPWRLEGAEPTFPGTWEWVVLPDMGGKFDKVKERLLAGSSLFSIVVSIPTISYPGQTTFLIIVSPLPGKYELYKTELAPASLAKGSTGTVGAPPTFRQAANAPKHLKAFATAMQGYEGYSQLECT